MATLYELTGELDSLLAMAEEMDTASEEERKAFEDTLESCVGSFEEKALAVGAFIRETEAKAEMVKAEARRLADKASALSKRGAWLREYLVSQMGRVGVDKVGGTAFDIRVRPNPEKVSVRDEAALPDEFVSVRVERRPDLKAIREALKSGRAVDGASLTRTMRVDIK